jgi:hypothetical protein
MCPYTLSFMQVSAAGDQWLEARNLWYIARPQGWVLARAVGDVKGEQFVQWLAGVFILSSSRGLGVADERPTAWFGRDSN